jgi:predicted deacylase
MVESQCIEHDIASFAPEGGILGREGMPRIGFDMISVGVCKRGIYNVMKKMGMLKGELQLPKKQFILERENAKEIVAEKGGILNFEVKPCQQVKKGDLLGRIFSVRTFQEVQALVAPMDGYVWGMPGYPLINAGESIMSVRRLYKTIEN